MLPVMQEASMQEDVAYQALKLKNNTATSASVRVEIALE